MRIVQGTCRITVIGAALIGLLVLTGCGLVSPGGPVTSAPRNTGRPASIILEDFISALGDTFDNSGVTWSAWDRSNRNYSTRTCYIGDSKGNQYTVHDSTGGKVADPQIVINAIKKYWETRNYTIGRIAFDPEPYPGGEINAVSPSGIFVQLLVSPNGSALTVTSDCTLDPALEPSLDGTSTPAPTLTTNAGRSANVILEGFISALGDAFDNSGVTWSAWDRSNRNYSTRTCYLDDSKGNQYTVHDSTGGKVADPQIAINAIKTYWETRNYTIGNVVNWPGGSIELTATSPSGIQVIFGASTNGSSLTVTSDCTLDPALEPSLDGTSIPAPSASS